MTIEQAISNYVKYRCSLDMKKLPVFESPSMVDIGTFVYFWQTKIGDEVMNISFRKGKSLPDSLLASDPTRYFIHEMEISPQYSYIVKSSIMEWCLEEIKNHEIK